MSITTSNLDPQYSSATHHYKEVDCYHCGLPTADANEFTLVINDQTQSFCCVGCQAIASTIHEGGLDQFYQYRSALNHRPDEYSLNSFDIYDSDDLQQGFVEQHDNHEKTAYLVLDDITCAACVWLIEQRLQSLVGVQSVRVNAASHQCSVRWHDKQTSLSQLMSALALIGYPPQPLSADPQQKQRKHKQRYMLMRLAVAAFGMMQVSMVAIALYAGALQGMDPQWQQLLRWVSLVVATPVVLFSAQPFWSVAWKSIRRRYLTMEVPVALAIVLAYIASAWATITASGEVYFDSVSMFTFFLLLGRYLEMRTRFRNYQKTANLTRLLPMTVLRVLANTTATPHHDDSQLERIPLAQLQVHDRVRINSGDTIPCDGRVIEGSSAIIEAVITGEEQPVMKQIGDDVIAGTVNTDGTLLIEATAVQQQTRLSTIEKLVNFAQQDKPKIQIIADKVASYFVLAVLVIAAAVFTFWWFKEPASALWITLSVLVVTCPCALSLATPTVLTATMAKMRSKGLLVLNNHVIETLPAITRAVFDKTGTLTYGRPKVAEVKIATANPDGLHTNTSVLAIAAALEQGSSHPIAHAFAPYQGAVLAQQRVIVTGAGIKGLINGQAYALGKPSFAVQAWSAAELADGTGESIDHIDLPSAGQWLLLSENNHPLAWFRLSDQLRDSAATAIQQLQQQGVSAEILSGDNATVVSDMAARLGNIPYSAAASPEEKLAYVKRQQQLPETAHKESAQRVLMVGDGINDVPVLAGADVSIAMDSASDFARTHADAVLLNGQLTILPEVIHTARDCQTIIRQNVGWALLYNITALPLAAAGLIPPYLAAIGMSLSSLVVVFNALRIMRRHTGSSPTTVRNKNEQLLSRGCSL